MEATEQVQAWIEAEGLEQILAPYERNRAAAELASGANPDRVRMDLRLVAQCETCKAIRAANGFGPPHFASKRCRSGGHNHCTCDTCF